METPEKQFGIVPCRLCGHPTRSARLPESAAPGTKTRRNGMCRTCAGAKVDGIQRRRPGVTEETLGDRHKATVSALEAFMRARNARLDRLKAAHQ